MRILFFLLVLLLAATAGQAEDTTPSANSTQAQPAAAPPRTGDTRDPFTNAFKYEEAIHHITVLGIVTAGAVERIIVHIDGYDELAVLKTGDLVAVNHNGVRHEFVINAVNPKSVRFVAGTKAPKKDPNAFTYEVFLL